MVGLMLSISREKRQDRSRSKRVWGEQSKEPLWLSGLQIKNGKRVTCRAVKVLLRKTLLEIFVSRFQAMVKRNPWFPSQSFRGQGYIRLTTFGIILGKLVIIDFRWTVVNFANLLGQLPDGEFVWIPQVHGTNGFFLLHQLNEAFPRSST